MITVDIPEITELIQHVAALEVKLETLTEPDQVLKVDDAAKLLRIGANEVRAMAASGRLPATFLGNGWKFSRRQLLAWLREQCAGNTAPQAREQSPAEAAD